MKKYSRKHLEEVLDYLSDQYYNTSSEIFSDDQYDLIKEYVLSQRPVCNKHFEKIGSYPNPICNRTVELPLWLGSLDKLKPSDEKPLTKWLNKFSKEVFVITPKIDGLSCLIEYDFGKLKMFTRGDGKIGKDITVFSYLLPNLNLQKKFYVRGELVMKKKTFEDYQDKFTNARAMLVGVINSLTTSVDIDFIAYEFFINGDKLEPQIQQIKNLKDLGFNTPMYEVIEKGDINSESLTEILLQWKTVYQYQMDGIVITNNSFHDRNTSDNPKYQIAYKILCEENIVDAVVEKVEWKISKRGLLKPRVKIFPVEVGGITINYSSGFNAKYIFDNKIGPNTKLSITRSGDVIPYILKVIDSTYPDMPPESTYKWVEGQSPVEIMTTSEDIIPEQQQALVVNFFKTLKTKNISEKTIEKLFNAGKTTIFSILDMSASDFKKIEGFATVSSNKIYENIKTSLKNVSLSVLLDAGNVFSHGIGTRKLDEIFLRYPTIMDETDLQEIHNKIMTVKGFSKISADAFVEGFNKAVKYLKLIEKYATIDYPKSSSLKSEKNLFLKNKTVVFSGFRDDDLEKVIKNMEGRISSSISKNTDILIVKDTSKASSKINTANELGVKIMNLQDFIKLI
jgi:NAD-dependent DNA ligase